MMLSIPLLGQFSLRFWFQSAARRFPPPRDLVGRRRKRIGDAGKETAARNRNWQNYVGVLAIQISIHERRKMIADAVVQTHADHRAAQRGEIGFARGARRQHRSEEHTSELQSRRDLVCRLLLE